MANTCLTPAEFLKKTGTEFSTFGAQSTGTIQVDAVPLAGATITIGGVVLTAVAGARTSGSNDFSIDSGTDLGVAEEIVAAISDPLNGFHTFVTAAIQITGIPIVLLTTVTTGFYSTIPFSTSDAVSFVLSGTELCGGEEELVNILQATCAMLGGCWGDKKSYGHCYLAAHFLTVASNGAGGPVSSRTIDRISEAYAVSPATDPELGTTKWGLLYLSLRKTLPNIGIAVGRSGNGFIGIVGGGCGC